MYPPEIRAAARALRARGVSIRRISEFFCAKYATTYGWLNPRRCHRGSVTL